MNFFALSLLAILSLSTFAAVEPPDADKDGVVDAMDKSPSTKGNSSVNSYGCIKGEKVVLSIDVNFATDSVVANQQYRAQVATLADFLKQNPGVNVELKGYADKEGDSAYNKDLALRRAEAIKGMLVNDYKIKAERVVTVSRGETDRNAPHEGMEGRYRNRRVEAYVLQ